MYSICRLSTGSETMIFFSGNGMVQNICGLSMNAVHQKLNFQSQNLCFAQQVNVLARVK